MSAGSDHSCALPRTARSSAGAITPYGQLGNGTITDSSTPVSVQGITSATQLSAGNDHTCALLSGGTVKCWGDNDIRPARQRHVRPTARLRFRSAASRTPPRSAPATTTPAPSSPAARSSAGATTLRPARRRHDDRQLDPGLRSAGIYDRHPDERRQRPHLRPPLRRHGRVLGLQRRRPARRRLRRRQAHDPGLRSQRHHERHPGQRRRLPHLRPHLRRHGQVLGLQRRRRARQRHDGASSSTPVPVYQSGKRITNATQVSAGGYHTCALLSGGTVECWGCERLTASSVTATTQTARPRSRSAASRTPPRSAPAASHTCALVSGGTIRCWGDNYDGQLGDGTRMTARLRSGQRHPSATQSAPALPHLRPPLRRHGRVLGLQRLTASSATARRQTARPRFRSRRDLAANTPR